MTRTLVAIGTRKGLWLARTNDRNIWSLDGPHFLMREVPSIGIDTRREPPRLLVGVRSEHWGPTVMRSDDLGQSWDETPKSAIHFPEDTGAAVERVWQITPDLHDDDVVWASTEPQALWHSDDRGETFSLVRACGSIRTARSGAQGSAGPQSTRSCPTRPPPPRCSWR